MAKALMLPGPPPLGQSCQQPQGRLVGSTRQGKHLRQQGQRRALGRGVRAGPSLLGIGFLQQARPELLVVERTHEKELLVQDRQAIINHHLHPLAAPPELGRGMRDQVSQRKYKQRGRMLGFQLDFAANSGLTLARPRELQT